jgi:hypothetical protein
VPDKSCRAQTVDAFPSIRLIEAPRYIIPSMDQGRDKAHLVENMRDAVVAFCLTGIVAALSFRDVLRHTQHRSYWLLDLRSILPASAAAVVNLGFYAYLLWLGIMFYRSARRAERVVVAGWFASLFLGWIQNLVSMSAVAAINWVKAACMLTALLAALDIVVKIERREETNGTVPH